MQFGKFYVLLHSFDVLLLVLVLLLYFDLGILALGVLVGAGVHLAMDVIGNPVSIQGYFLICRIHKRFDFRVFLRKSLL